MDIAKLLTSANLMIMKWFLIAVLMYTSWLLYMLGISPLYWELEFPLP